MLNAHAAADEPPCLAIAAGIPSVSLAATTRIARYSALLRKVNRGPFNVTPDVAVRDTVRYVWTPSERHMASLRFNRGLH